MADLEWQLFVAAADGDVAALQEALAAGAQPNPDDEVTTALHHASKGGHVACVQALLAAGADADAADGDGLTALHRACERGQLACVQALLAAGADIECPSPPTPLHVAAEAGAVQCVAALLAAGANPIDALWYAAKSSSVEVVTALLDVAPDLQVVDNLAGEGPLCVALEYHHWDVARCLLECGSLPQVRKLLAALEGALEDAWDVPFPLSLYAPLVARQPLKRAHWARVPSPCPGLGTALPAVLARSEAEAALLVVHLPAEERERLLTAALCLKRVERRRRASLPAELLRPLLLAAVE